MQEIKVTLGAHGISVDARHIQMLGDCMTYRGAVLGINRFGISRMRTSALMCGRPRTTDLVFDAAARHRVDPIKGVSECIIMGSTINVGTGLCKLLYDFGANPSKTGGQTGSPTVGSSSSWKVTQGRAPLLKNWRKRVSFEDKEKSSKAQPELIMDWGLSGPSRQVADGFNGETNRPTSKLRMLLSRDTVPSASTKRQVQCGKSGIPTTHSGRSHTSMSLELAEATAAPPSAVQNFLMDAFEVSGCAGSEVMLEMSVGTKSKKTKTALRSKDSDEDPMMPGRFLFQGDKGRMTPLVAVLPTSPAEQLDVLLSLYSRITGFVTDADWQRIGFARLKVAELREWDGDTQTPLWCALSNMAHLPSSIEPGAILCSLAKSGETVLTRGVPNCKPVKFQLRCYLNMARNLNCEGDRVPSSFCEIACAGQRERTKVVPQTSSPYWAEMVEMTISLQCSLQNMRCYSEPIQLTVYDVLGKTLLEKVADVTNNAKQLASGALGGNIPISNKDGNADFNDEAGIAAADIDVAKIGEEYAGYVKDQAMAQMMGDVMAVKRLGEVKGGRKVIGRQKIHFRKLLHPLTNYKMRQRWIKLKGGVMGTGWAVGRVGYEFLNVVHIAALLPKLPVYEPDLRFLLKDGQDSDSKLLAEGRIGLAEHLPWVSDKAKAKEATEAKDTYSDGEGGAYDGMPVSDADEEGANYVEVVLGNQPLGAEEPVPVRSGCPTSAQASEDCLHCRGQGQLPSCHHGLQREEPGDKLILLKPLFNNSQ
eukprot:g1800.t1